MHFSRMCTTHSSSHQPGGSASVHAGIHPPGVDLETHPWCGPGDPPGCGLGDLPGVGLETPWVWAWRPPGQTPQAPPWVWAWKSTRHGGIHPLETCKACWDITCKACWDTTPSPHCGQTDTCKNITIANFICGR